MIKALAFIDAYAKARIAADRGCRAHVATQVSVASAQRLFGLGRRLRPTALALAAACLTGMALWSAPALAAGPSIESETFTNVATTAADLHAKINPEGDATTYAFEYGPDEAAYAERTATTSLGSTSSATSVTAEVTGLAVGALYHFRVVASSEAGEVDGAEELFTTQVGASALPNERGYEMVTPLENEDAEVYVPTGDSPGGEETLKTTLPVRAAANGQAVAYVAAPTGDQTEYIARRNPTGGWTQTSLQPFGYAGVPYVSFSPNLEYSVLESDRFSLAPSVPEYVSELYSAPTGSLAFTPFASASTEIWATTIGGFHRRLGWSYSGASANFKHLLFMATAALTPEAVSGTASGTDNLYESFEGKPHLVNVLPNGSTEPDAFFGAVPSEDITPVSVSNAISANGELIYWTDAKTHTLYVREGGTKTVEVDASHGSGASGGGVFWTANAEGTKAFFTDCSKLTSESTAVSSANCTTGNDLYEFEPGSETLTDLTIDNDVSDTDGANVQGVVAASESGEYVYFVADGVLASGAKSGSPNLYLDHDGANTFIATLSSSDDSIEVYGASNGMWGDWRPSLSHKTAAATANGRDLIFVSSARLTAYDNVDGAGKGVAEVYVYDASDGEIDCASCDWSEASPPEGDELAGAVLPATNSEIGTFQLRWISEDGDEAFFESEEALVRQDTNHRMDVYEWQRGGTGGCEVSVGCIYLLSGGTSYDGSYLIDTSASGEDVFIATRAHLVPEDDNEFYNVYDVRVGATAPPAAQRCSGTGCQGVPSAPPIFATPASVTFSGAGDYAPGESKTVSKKATKKVGKKKAKKKAIKKPKKKTRKKAKKNSGKKAGRKDKARNRQRAKSTPAGRHRDGRDQGGER